MSLLMAMAGLFSLSKGHMLRASQSLLPHRLPPGQLKVQVLKPHPLLPCEEDGVGMFGVFSAQNSDGEFAVGHNTRENRIFLYIKQVALLFQQGKTQGSCEGSFCFPERKAPSLSACVLESNIKQCISTQHRSLEQSDHTRTPQYFFLLPPA